MIVADVFGRDIVDDFLKASDLLFIPKREMNAVGGIAVFVDHTDISVIIIRQNVFVIQLQVKLAIHKTNIRDGDTVDG